jgi:type I restriction enzyme M protein
MASSNDNVSGARIGFEAELWKAADALRGSMDAAEYKHVVLGLLFLKYISDAFEEQHEKLKAEADQGADPEDIDEYKAVGVFWVPPEARWSHLKAQAKQPTIGQLVDDAMAGIERDNPSLKSVLPKDYARPGLDKTRLGQLIDNVSNIKVGDKAARSKDVLGRVYEYFLSQFASQEGKKGGEFYTPRCVVKLLVTMLEPYKGRVYDPCCGSSGMFVQSEEFIKDHSGRVGDISIYGQESNYTTWRLAKMNLAIRGIDGNIKHGDTFHNDQHPDLKADYILANPPFNISDWGGERLRDDKRWVYGVPPNGNANFAWVQHMAHKLSPTGVAGFVLANGSMSSNQSGEGEIRQKMVEADLVDCMVALPGQLFYSTQIPACLWFLARDKRNHKFRDRRGHVLFIDARKMGRLIDRTHRELTPEEITRITTTYHAWRGESDAGDYEDIAGFCKSAPLDEVKGHGHVLTPGRYVGAEAAEDDAEPFEEKMSRLVTTLRELQEQATLLDDTIDVNMRGLGYGA